MIRPDFPPGDIEVVLITASIASEHSLRSGMYAAPYRVSASDQAA